MAHAAGPDADGRGYPDVGQANPELIRIGIKHFLEGFRLIGMAVTESPEAHLFRQKHGIAHHT